MRRRKKVKFEVKNAFGIVVIIVVVIVFLLMLGSRGTNIRDRANEKSKLVSIDLVKDYPSTPREVVTLYSRITKCLYGEEYDDDEYKMLLERLRFLMDQELLDKNPYSEHYNNVKKDVAEYKAESKVILSYKVANSDAIQYQNLEGKDYAMVDVQYNMRSDEGEFKTKQQFVLRKDVDGSWRILYWLSMDSDDKQ
ncbi:MAG: hypothetical protein E7242_08310 [Lachnospiraceae bacterium]|nr:hypothetical protein [Lachnospiraceae bacterium]